MNCIQEFPVNLFATYTCIILPAVPHITSFIFLSEFPTKILYPFVILLVCAPCTAIYSHLFNPLNAKLNPICHLLALLGAHYIFHVSGVRVN